MANPSLQIGNDNWAIKEDNLLGYSTAGTRFVPQPITMTRASAGTRVNSSGLVETVELLGGELVANGDFATDSDWTKGTGWTISGGSASYNGLSGTQNINQSFASSLVGGSTYIFTLEVLANEGTGTNVIDLTNSGDRVNSSHLEVGTHTFTHTVTATSNSILIYGRSGEVFEIDNVSVKESTKNDLARVDYTGSTSSLLAEPQRTNLLPYSEDLTQWNKGNLTISSDAIVSPDGTQNADTLNVIDDNDFIYEGATTTASTEYVFTFYVKRGTIAESSLKLAIYDDTNNAFIVSDISYSASDSEWTRVTQSFTTPVGCILIRAYAFRNSSTTLGTFSVWGAQVEEGSYATSYIPNFGTAAGVTRNQDIFTRDGIGSLINSTEGCVFGEGNFIESSISGYMYFVSLSDGTLSNRLEIRQTSGNLQFLWRVSTYQSQIVTSGIDVGSNFKFAISYSSANIKFYVNGNPIGTINTPTLWSADTLNRLGLDDGSGSYPFYGKVKQLQVFKTALTNSELIALTTI